MVSVSMICKLKLFGGILFTKFCINVALFEHDYYTNDTILRKEKLPQVFFGNLDLPIKFFTHD